MAKEELKAVKAVKETKEAREVRTAKEEKKRKSGSKPSKSKNRSSPGPVRRRVKDTVEKDILHLRGFITGDIMGEGAYSKVIKAKRKTDQLPVAVKIIDHSKASNRFLSKFLPRELSIFRGLKHPNLIAFIDTWTASERTFLVMELCPKGDLEQHISLRGPFKDGGPSDTVHKLMRDILEGMKYMHGRKLCHRDLKCENVMLGAEGEAKIGDFGFARVMNPDDLSNTYCGSRAYAPPELLSQTPYKGAIGDCWSIGVIFYIALTARMPFDDRDVARMTQQQKARSFFVDPDAFKAKASALLLAFLNPDPPARITAAAALQHPWFQSN